MIAPWLLVIYTSAKRGQRTLKLFHLPPLMLTQTLRRHYRKAPNVSQAGGKVPYTRLALLLRGMVVGTATYEIRGNTLYFGSLGILEEFRRNGITRQLISYLESKACELGLTSISCETVLETGNPSIFQRLGFSVKSTKVSAEFECPLGNIVHEVLMMKSIPQVNLENTGTTTSRVTFVAASPTHSLGKQGRPFIFLLEGLGVENDAHSGKTVKHRSRVARDPSQQNLRQVHLIPSEMHEELRKQGFPIQPGQMGENINTEGLDLLGLPTGSRLKLGCDAVIEVTGVRNPCAQLDQVYPGLMAATLDRTNDGNLVRKAGIMVIVVYGGKVSPGDEIVVELPPLPHRSLKPV